ncbi:DNase I-like protein [Hesseltinella vesiculosa]|uniref:DNase I-like protein n=1 Tax=Hesseltinella vesiculosa TaxID=101127 RepID=A0A1X2GJL1_9FUNG|nr:DNase I-like protein [Hesseltinella vesiculosa]
MAVFGSFVATGVNEVCVRNTLTGTTVFSQDVTAGGDHDRIRSLVFLPALRLDDQGRYLWVGMNDGTILSIDCKTKAITKVTSSHKQPISFMFRRRNAEIWTLDESGLLAIWPVVSSTSAGLKLNSTAMLPQKYMVMSKTTAALVADKNDLWLSNGRSLHVYRGLDSHKPTSDYSQQQVRIPNDLGNITGLAVVPFHHNVVFAGHDDGKVTLWDKQTLEKVQVYTVSLYGICAMTAVDQHYLWTGYNTGMVYVYDTRPERWSVVKLWSAHKSPLTSLLVDDSRFLRNDGLLQVITGDTHGEVALWDGMMTDSWHDRQLQLKADSYSNYRPIQVMICSWNIDANKPEKLTGKDNDLVHEWLGEADSPDVIVVGIQEIIDLESKKQTAKSLFASRKKIETLEDADEMLTHRYRLWHDHLVRVIGDNYGRDAYSVYKTDQLVGLFSCVFVKKTEMSRVWNCDATVVKTGLKVMNKSIHGNKGGIAIRFMYEHSSFCFVNCHLAAGQSHVQDRNADAEGILNSAAFPAYQRNMDLFADGGDGSLILDHEHVFLSGDLNYRIAMDRKQVLDLLRQPDKNHAWDALQVQDQLKRQNVTNPLFKLMWFQEAPLRFDPTYKYDRGTNNYDSSEKKRVPAWCDRVLWRSRHTENQYYRRHEVQASDHRPISAAFTVLVKEVDGDRRDQLLDNIEQDWFHLVDKVIEKKKLAYLLDFEHCSHDQALQLLQNTKWDIDAAVQQL